MRTCRYVTTPEIVDHAWAQPHESSVAVKAVARTHRPVSLYFAASARNNVLNLYLT